VVPYNTVNGYTANGLLYDPNWQNVFIVLAGRETECQPVKVSLYYCIFYFTL